LLILSDFEPVRDLENDESPVADSIRFEEHLRREVPRIFRILLDTEVGNELQSIEERLKSRLLELLQEAQNQAATTYHSSSQVAPGTLTARQFVESQHSSLEPSTTPVLSNTSKALLEKRSIRPHLLRPTSRDIHVALNVWLDQTFLNIIHPLILAAIQTLGRPNTHSKTQYTSQLICLLWVSLHGQESSTIPFSCKILGLLTLCMMRPGHIIPGA
jgi:hypothetical protein